MCFPVYFFLLSCVVITGYSRLVIRSPFEAIISSYDKNHSSVFCEIENDDFTANGVCVSLVNVNTKEALVSNSCLDTYSMVSSFELERVPVGVYNMSIQSVVKDGNGRTVQQESSKLFSIYGHNEMIPLVQFSHDGDLRHHIRGKALDKSHVELQFVADHPTGVSTVYIPYRILTRFPISLEPPANDARTTPQLASVLSAARVGFLTEFSICVDLFDTLLDAAANPATRPFANVCSPMQAGVDSMELFNVPVGSYRIEIYVQHKEFSGQGVRFYEADGPALRLFVDHLHRETAGVANFHPAIVVRDGNVKEFGFDKHKASGATVAFEFALNGYIGAVSQVQTCLTVSKLAKDRVLPLTVVVEFMCLAAEQRSVSLSPIPEGDYDVQLQLRMTSAPFALLESVCALSAAVRQMEELVPTYDWQRLHAWHSIPSGIITRLPVGAGVHKEAKIAEPWTLQLLLPKPKSKSKRRARKSKFVTVDGPHGPQQMQAMECVTKSSFLRMPVSRRTTTSEIIDAACKLCNIAYSPVEEQSPAKTHGCVYLTAAATPGENGETTRITLTENRGTTVQSTDLFNLNHRTLHVNESCLVAAPEPIEDVPETGPIVHPELDIETGA